MKERLCAYRNGITNYNWVVNNKLDNGMRGVIIRGEGGETRIFDLPGNHKNFENFKFVWAVIAEKHLV